MVSNYGDGDSDLENLSGEDRQAREGLHTSAMDAAQGAVQRAQAAVDNAGSKKETKAAKKDLDDTKSTLKDLEDLQAQADLDQLRAVQEETEGRWAPEGTMYGVANLLNGIVLVFGLLLVAVGYWCHLELEAGCHETPGLSNQTCVNLASLGVGFLGFFHFLVAGLSLYSLRLGGFLGRNLVRVCTLLLIVLAFFLMLTGIAFAIVAGAITSLSRLFDLEFDTIRLQAEQEDCNICATGTDADGDGCFDEKYTTSRCRGKLKRQAEDHLDTIMTLLGGVCAGFLGVLYLTLQAVHIFVSTPTMRRSL